jgi:hypothetical protein
MPEWIIHLGTHISEHLYDHRIDHQKWEEQKRKFISDPDWILIERDAPYHLYRTGSLTYEFDHSGHHQCYTDVILKISKEIYHVSNAFVYSRQRTFYQYDFQPILNYFNQRQIERTTLSCGNVVIQFEFEPTIKSYQIILVTGGTDGSPIPPSLNSDLIGMFGGTNSSHSLGV